MAVAPGRSEISWWATVGLDFPVGPVWLVVLGGLFLKDCKKSPSPWFYGVYHLQTQSNNKEGVSHRVGIDFLQNWCEKDIRRN